MKLEINKKITVEEIPVQGDVIMGFEETYDRNLVYEEALKYAGEMISVGESGKALKKICDVLGVATDYFDD